MLGPLAKSLRSPTAAVLPTHYRTYVLLAVGTTAAAVLHFLVTVVFWALGVWPLVALNVVSLAVYVAGFALNRRGHHVATVVLSMLELAVHQALACVCLGWDAGFQYYLIAITTVVFYLPAGRGGVKLAILAATAATYLGLAIWTRAVPPLYPLNATVLGVMEGGNVVAIFALMALFAHNYTRAAETAEQRRELEHARAEGLLRNILPESIAERLKSSADVIADGIPEATILFADIVGFTPLAERTSPERLVGILNEIFSKFDDLVTARGLEKIKTIGDAYMVAAGVPEQRDDHVAAMADLALDMMDLLGRTATALGIPLRMRIGVHTGPVVAGVIGKHKFVYDLWGDSVNLAARMESHGVAGEIQVTQEVVERSGDRFVFEDRGLVDVKGKGPTQAWLLKGRRS